MGDRTNVRLTILLAHFDKAKDIIDRDLEDSIIEGNLVYTEYNEINYGNLNFIDELRQAGVPYNSRWEDGNDYAAGEEICRFNDQGEIEIIEIYDDNKNPNLDTLIKYIDNPIQLREYILNHKINITTLPWDNQEAYSKIYLTKQLIAGKKS
jgi:hypothetical protein